MQGKVLDSEDSFCIKETFFNNGRGGFIFTTSLLILPNYNQLLISCKAFFSFYLKQ